MGCYGSKTAQDVLAPQSSDQKPATRSGGGGVKIIHDNPGSIFDSYEVEKKMLGEGSYGSVRKAVNKETRQIRAVKTMALTRVKHPEKLRKEIEIMKRLDHPNAIKLFETFQDKRSIYLVMELCGGGELFDRIIEEGFLSEVQAAGLMQQSVRAVKYMHDSRICHRDLKPENFLFTKKERIEHSTLKIIDFGLSREFTPGTWLTTKVGTPYYVAPQVLYGRYDQSCDMWGIGVIMYVMLCGYPPFRGNTDGEVMSRVQRGKWKFRPEDWDTISLDAKDLVTKLLQYQPERRLTAEEALKHAWIQGKATRAPAIRLQQGFVDNLRSFRSDNKLKKVALHIIAGQLRHDQIKGLQDIFMALDSNSDGLLTAAEMKEGLTKAGLEDIPKDLQEILADIDVDRSGVIDYTEFLAATLDKRAYLEEAVCWSAFHVFDRNGDGKVTLEELRSVLGDDEVQHLAGAARLSDMMREIDGNGDGVIDFEEFMQMMRGKTQ